jgi:hypothetical protein
MKILKISTEFLLTYTNIKYFLIVMIILSSIRYIFVLFQSKLEIRDYMKLDEENKTILKKKIILCINENKKLNVLKKKNLEDLVELSTPLIIKKLKINNDNLEDILNNNEINNNIYVYLNEIHDRYF